MLHDTDLTPLFKRYWPILLVVALSLGAYAKLSQHFADQASEDVQKGQAALERTAVTDHKRGEEYYKLGRYDMAMTFFRWGAERGRPYDQGWMGGLYARGQGVDQDYAAAFQWFQKAADQNDPTGQCELGYYYLYGYGVAQNGITAKEWFQKAADQGDAQARAKLAELAAGGR